MSAKFRNDRAEVSCGKVIPGELSDRYAAYGGIVCLRTKGHKGKCIAVMCDAAAADVVCPTCRQPLPKPKTKAKRKRRTR